MKARRDRSPLGVRPADLLTEHRARRRAPSEDSVHASQISKLAGKDKKIDPRPACTLFTKLVANGEATIKWMDANKDWCQVPDLAVTNFKTEHQSVSKTKGQACQAAAKMAAMEKQARQAQQQQQKGGGMLGGPGLTGQYKVPQGAL
jgi:primosomal replication protein N